MRPGGRCRRSRARSRDRTRGSSAPRRRPPRAGAPSASRRSSRTARRPSACSRCSALPGASAASPRRRRRQPRRRSRRSIPPARRARGRKAGTRRRARRPASRRRPRRRGGSGSSRRRSPRRSPRRRSASARRSPSTSSTRSGSTTASIRSCDSETMISNGSMSASRSGTRATSMSIPTPPAEAISPDEEVSPAAPRSWSETSRPRSSSSRQHSISFFSSNGSPICTVGPLLVALLELGRGEHRGAADPVAPGRRAHQHDRVADPRRRGADHPVGSRDPGAHRVDQAVLLVGRLEVRPRRRPSRTPIELP